MHYNETLKWYSLASTLMIYFKETLKMTSYFKNQWLFWIKWLNKNNQIGVFNLGQEFQRWNLFSTYYDAKK